MEDDVRFEHDREGMRYVLTVGGETVASLVYRDAPGLRVLVHTDVYPGHEGKGYAGRLASAALDDIRASGLGISPVCTFVASYIRRHPEYRDLVGPRRAV